MEPCCFQWCSVPGQWAQSGTQELLSEHPENLFYCSGPLEVPSNHPMTLPAPPGEPRGLCPQHQPLSICPALPSQHLGLTFLLFLFIFNFFFPSWVSGAGLLAAQGGAEWFGSAAAVLGRWGCIGLRMHRGAEVLLLLLSPFIPP